MYGINFEIISTGRKLSKYPKPETNIYIIINPTGDIYIEYEKKILDQLS